jgi:hypothetical protein
MAVDVQEFTVEAENGQKVTVEVVAIGELDSHYGADADGNRGIPLWTVKEFKFEIPQIDDSGEHLRAAAREELHDLILAEADVAVWNFGE